MPIWSISFSVVCITLVFACTPTSLYADEVASVLRVIDGDTMVVRIGSRVEHIRLLGIDAPELKDRKSGVAQCFSHEARRKLKKLTHDKEITLVRDPQNKNRDTYGRLLRYVLSGVTQKSESLNQQLVSTGFVRVYGRFEFEKKSEFIKQEKHARAQRFGLWGACAKKL